MPRSTTVNRRGEPALAPAADDRRIAEAIQATLSGISADLRALKSRYPQLAGLDRMVITGSQLSYNYGEVRCGSKARPCTFSGPHACRVTVNLTQIKSREEADLHPSVSRLFALPDGTYLEFECDILAAPTRQGRAFAQRAGQIIDARVKSLEQLYAVSASRRDAMTIAQEFIPGSR